MEFTTESNHDFLLFKKRFPRQQKMLTSKNEIVNHISNCYFENEN